METYPYPSSEGIIDLVRKSEFDRLKWELEEQRAELTRWQALAGQLAEALKDCKNRAMDKSIETHADDHAKSCIDDIWEWSESALAAYESATSATARHD